MWRSAVGTSWKNGAPPEVGVALFLSKFGPEADIDPALDGSALVVADIELAGEAELLN